ncbi:MAG: nicotinate-nucleotide adenylyltransferase [Peptococcaceae bacterium]|jgi:nicotinate-nucleotide adenylyltransferase|nr:nicotinate-nucleotide adenylyltransferase [Peptococcaceae bacterium]
MSEIPFLFQADEDVDLTGVNRLGLMGGTFDPIHQGHLVTAEAARSGFNLDRVIFVPSGQPPHKSGQQITPKEKRYLMTELATVTNPFFDVSRVEVSKDGYSYSADTVRYFRRSLAAGSEIYFITGADAIMEIISWKNIDELFANCTFIAATRPGVQYRAMLEKLERQLKPAYRDKVIAIEVPAMAISSTDIRRRVAEGRTIKYLLPETVEHYIAKQGLYRV